MNTRPYSERTKEEQGRIDRGFVEIVEHWCGVKEVEIGDGVYVVHFLKIGGEPLLQPMVIGFQEAMEHCASLVELAFLECRLTERVGYIFREKYSNEIAAKRSSPVQK